MSFSTPFKTAAPLASTLTQTVPLLAQVLQNGQSLNEALAHTAASDLAQKAAVQDLAFHTLRHLALAQALLKSLVNRPLSPDVQHLLTIALALLAAEGNKESLKYPPHTLTNETVLASLNCENGPRVKGLVNGVLRTFLREKQPRLVAALRHPVARWNAPQWWIDGTKTAWPDHWQAILDANRLQPPLTLRANRRVNSRAEFMDRLIQEGHPCEALGPDEAVIVNKPRPITQLPGFTQGAFSVQDEGAQRAAKLLDVQPGMRVLDACAAPGGKTAHILELADCMLTAVDSDAARLKRVIENLQRLQLRAKTVHADAVHTRDWWDGELFDRILLDAPCTASGIVRRHPDIIWLRQAADTQRLAKIQQALLQALWPLLKPGGKLLYATCSIWPSEGSQQIDAFLQRNPNAVALNAAIQLLPLSSKLENHDGFFYASIVKS